jgi:hypothetical protein
MKCREETKENISFQRLRSKRRVMVSADLFVYIASQCLSVGLPASQVNVHCRGNTNKANPII